MERIEYAAVIRGRRYRQAGHTLLHALPTPPLLLTDCGIRAIQDLLGYTEMATMTYAQVLKRKGGMLPPLDAP